jgi:GH24 family phage-related lysozyme (muramidase)
MKYILVIIALALYGCDGQKSDISENTDNCPQDCEISTVGLTLIRQFEGFVPYVYKDAAGLDTIGYGHLLKEGETFDIITPAQAEDLLREDVKEAERAVRRLVRVPITQRQFDALVSFTFNLGYGNLHSSTLLSLLNDGKIEEVAPQFNRWVYADGKKLKGLELRRKAEAMLFG